LSSEGKSLEVRMREMTQARIRLGRFGAGLPTKVAQSFLLDHARAREAVWSKIDEAFLAESLDALGMPSVSVTSDAQDRAEYLQRPDLGRKLSRAGQLGLAEYRARYDVAIVIADGLSATAVNVNAIRVIQNLVASAVMKRWVLAPVVIASNARVAIGDLIARAVGGKAVVVLIGERPGLSASDSLGAYITFDPKEATPDSQRNCISNIRENGLDPQQAAFEIGVLLDRMFRECFSGIKPDVQRIGIALAQDY